jgi:hypothetical protein
VTMKAWVQFPSGWIANGGLKPFRWEKEKGANNVAALMALMVIGHHANEEGVAALTYDKLSLATHLSRTKISAVSDAAAMRSRTMRRSPGASFRRRGSMSKVALPPLETSTCGGGLNWTRSSYIF